MAKCLKVLSTQMIILYFMSQLKIIKKQKQNSF